MFSAPWMTSTKLNPDQEVRARRGLVSVLFLLSAVGTANLAQNAHEDAATLSNHPARVEVERLGQKWPINDQSQNAITICKTINMPTADCVAEQKAELTAGSVKNVSGAFALSTLAALACSAAMASLALRRRKTNPDAEPKLEQS